MTHPGRYSLSPARQKLVESLESCRAVDAPEEKDRRRMIHLLVTEAACFDRGHFVPGHFTASGFLLAPDHSGLLLIHHKKLGRWLQPGGHALPNEDDPLEMVKREIEEETGIVDIEVKTPTPFDLDIHRIPAKGNEPAHEHFDIRYLFLVNDPTQVRRCYEETNDIRWFTWDELAATALDPGMMRVVAKVRGHHPDR
ncbi:MAG: NUDIX hydrolase [Myxococcales bacterium]|nr:NUDIX hydrolase [Myxococcales bacterium]